MGGLNTSYEYAAGPERHTHTMTALPHAQPRVVRHAALLLALHGGLLHVTAAAPTPTFALNATTQQGDAVTDSVAGVKFETMATTGAGATKYWDLQSATLTRSGGASLTEGQEYTHAFCKISPLSSSLVPCCRGQV